MRAFGGRFVFVVAALFVAAGCTSESADDSATPVTAELTTTTEAAVTTETTLSDFQLEQAAIAQAEAEIEATVVAWYTFPRDTSLGEEGLPLAFVMGALYDRNLEVAAARNAAGEIQRARGGERIEILDIRVDLVEGIADVDVCAMGDGEVVNAETGEVIAADDGDSWNGRVQARLIEGVWLLENFSSDEATGGTECVFSE